MIELLETKLDAAQALKTFEAGLETSGAVANFIGYVRAEGRLGQVKSLYLQAYSPLTENNIKTVMTKAKEKWPLEAVSVIHRVGHMEPKDAIVFVAAASVHRRAALEAVDFLMDHLKTQAIFWKKEITNKGEVWIEPREEDYSDYARWPKDTRNKPK